MPSETVLHLLRRIIASRTKSLRDSFPLASFGWRVLDTTTCRDGGGAAPGAGVCAAAVDMQSRDRYAGLLATGCYAVPAWGFCARRGQEIASPKKQKSCHSQPQRLPPTPSRGLLQSDSVQLDFIRHARSAQKKVGLSARRIKSSSLGQYLCQLRKAEGGLRGMHTTQAGDLVANLAY